MRLRVCVQVCARQYAKCQLPPRAKSSNQEEYCRIGIIMSYLGIFEEEITKGNILAKLFIPTFLSKFQHFFSHIPHF